MSKYKEKFANKSAVIGILGLGYVGLPLAIEFCRAGFKVIGFDVDQAKMESLKRGASYIGHIADSDVVAIKDMLQVSSDFARVVEVDAIIITVPTPLSKNRDPDLSYVIETTDLILPFLKQGQVVSLESTTYPGTTEEIVKPMLEKSGLMIGKDLFLVYSPEREDPGRKDFTCRTTPKVCGGITAECLEVGLALYGVIVDQVVPVSSTKVAELTKLLENTHRVVNISLVNEMKILADRMSIDIHEVIDAASTKPFGFTPYYPGPGIGGHCIPVDPFYLTWKAREYGLHTRFIELAGEINSNMPNWIVLKVGKALNEHQKSVKGSLILILGVSYKKNIDDFRESPSLNLIKQFRDLGAKVCYSDPHVPKLKVTEGISFKMESVELSGDVVRNFDCVVVATAHDGFDYKMIIENSRLVVDTRGIYKKNTSNLVKA